MSWNATRSVSLENLGKLSDAKIDFLGVVPAYDSSWTQYYTYVFKNGKWNQPFPEFSIWEGGDYIRRVMKAKSGRSGYVGIYSNDMSDTEGGCEPSYREVRLTIY